MIGPMVCVEPYAAPGRLAPTEVWWGVALLEVAVQRRIAVIALDARRVSVHCMVQAARHAGETHERVLDPLILERGLDFVPCLRASKHDFRHLSPSAESIASCLREMRSAAALKTRAGRGNLTEQTLRYQARAVREDSPASRSTTLFLIVSGAPLETILNRMFRPFSLWLMSDAYRPSRNGAGVCQQIWGTAYVCNFVQYGLVVLLAACATAR
ncbi:MAG TPA: hypothetical protein VGV41_11580 [Pseudolabrys sp.]|jgi:hypothetical protein|uniref:hypothetical protein n=1 Tax=Pseudolabrys sp. TaxID=1960880 RepID=UPI002DDC9781|nr:hypothetical protein [Pseudolabrys sp.]HEV2629276.1 hypothetical protein [Pseudolabrys sp.]